MATSVSVSVITVKLVEDQPTPLKDAIIKAIFNNDSVADATIKSHLTGFNKSVDKYWNYGRDHFTNGLPEGTLTSGYVNVNAVTDVLSTLRGEPVTVEFANFDTLDTDFLSFEYLQSNQGFDPETLIVHSPDVVVSGVVTFKDSYLAFNQTDLVIEFSVDDMGSISSYSRTYTIPNISIKSSCYMVTYSLDSDPTNLIYWTYNSALGTYPTLNKNSSDQVESAYFPIVPLRTNRVNLTDVPGELKDTSNKMLKFLSLDMESVTNTISDNPDIDVIDDVYLMFALDIQSENKYSMEYLFKYFYDLSFRSKTTKEMFDRWTTGRVTKPLPKSSVDISDGEAKIELSYNYIDIKTVSGVIGSVGIVTRENLIRPTIRISDNDNWFSFSNTGRIYNSSLIFRKQINASQYIEVDVNGLLHTSWVYGNRTIVRSQESTLIAEPDQGFYIPVNRTTLKNTFDKSKYESEVLYDSLVVVINAVEITKLKWYQTSVFKAIITIVIIVVAIYFGQPQLALLLQAGSFTAATIIFLDLAITAILTSLAIDYVVEFLIEEIGGEAALILAAIATAYGIAQGKVSGIASLPWADALLETTAAVFRSIGNYVEDEMKELEDQMSDFLVTYEERQEEIDKASEFLDSSNVDPLSIVNLEAKLISIEAPIDFYQRTIHNTNPGVVSLDMISNYHDNALKLPELNESLVMNTRYEYD